MREPGFTDTIDLDFRRSLPSVHQQTLANRKAYGSAQTVSASIRGNHLSREYLGHDRKGIPGAGIAYQVLNVG